jgi:hypothetical protein
LLRLLAVSAPRVIDRRCCVNGAGRLTGQRVVLI